MKASILDLRRRMRDVLRALDQNETVTILYRGKPKGVLHPMQDGSRPHVQVTEHPVFGMWADREDLEDVSGAVDRLRQGRRDAV
jgi:antitoxin (DNA-binding transcriptional repressor) of toxin-antitoxin stability system